MVLHCWNPCGLGLGREQDLIISIERKLKKEARKRAARKKVVTIRLEGVAGRTTTKTTTKKIIILGWRE
jgi:hypothetical protein